MLALPSPTDADDFTPEERREMALATIGAVFLRSTGQAPIAERALVCWRGDEPEDLPGPGRRIDRIVPVDWDELEARVAAREDTGERL
jgi:hypothetical protein